ncbi:hypothetical protein K8T06_15265 [bacterium]|nr:hypothetical protein [bacterium]
MEKNWPYTDNALPLNGELSFNSNTDLIRDMQYRIMRRCSHIPRDGRITIRFIREFEWASNWAETLAADIDSDSTYQTGPGLLLPNVHNPEQILDLYRMDDSLTTTGLSQILTTDERVKVLERLKHFKLSEVDSSVIDALSEACNWVIMESFTEENCLRELAFAEDSVHRAELFMMMGNDVEAFREFKKITADEISNPENALALVELMERYESPKAALKVLKRWFLLEIVLHPLPFDLVYDLIPNRKTPEPTPRVRYLQSILLHSREMDLTNLHHQLLLVLPQQSTQKPELTDVNNRLRKFGLSMNRLDLILDESTPVNLYTMMSSLSEQLIHTADLARNINNAKLAIKALERAVLANFVIVNLPKPLFSDFLEPMVNDHHLTHHVILDSLDEIEELLEEILVFIGSDIEHYLLSKQISSLRDYIKRLDSANITENSSGMSSMS